MATTTTTNKSASSSDKAKGLSPEARQAVGVGALILCLLVGGGLIYWLLFASTPSRRTATVDPSLQTPDNMNRRGGGFRPPRPPDQPIMKMSDTLWQVRGDSGQMLAEKRSAGWVFNFNAASGLRLPPDQLKILSARVRMISDQAMAKQWAVTPEQVEKLRKMGATQNMNPRAEDQNAMATVWNTYMAAADGQPKQDAQKAVLQKLNEIVQANREPLLKVYADRTEQVKAILTPEQIQNIMK